MTLIKFIIDKKVKFIRDTYGVLMDEVVDILLNNLIGVMLLSEKRFGLLEVFKIALVPPWGVYCILYMKVKTVMPSEDVVVLYPDRTSFLDMLPAFSNTYTQWGACM
jgi:hypothetical protein